MPRIIGDVESSLVERVPRDRLAETALRLIAEEEPVLIVADGAWRIYWEVRREAHRRSLNWLLLEALDPREAEAAHTPLDQLIASRYTLLNTDSRLEAPLVPSPEKKVSRRELLRSLGTILLSHRDTVRVVDESRCGSPGCPLCTKACPYAAISYEDGVASVEDRECTGCGLCISMCPYANLVKYSATPQKLWEYLVGHRGEPGIALFACRDGIEELVEKLEAPHRTLIVPVECPGEATLELLLASHLAGYRPLIYCPRAAKTCGRKGVEAYAEKVLESYMEVAGLEEPPVIASPEELKSVEPLPPIAEPWESPPVDLREAARLASSRLLSRRGVEKPVYLKAPLQAVLEIDGEKCTLCAACIVKCPQNALSLERSGDYEAIQLYPLRCTGCPVCEKVCPEDALRVRYAALPTAQPVIVHREEIHRCPVCGKPVGPKKLIERTVAMMRAKGLPESVIENAYLCDECKVKKSLGLIKWSLKEWRKRREGGGGEG